MNVDLSFVRYAQCWEDADVLLEALNVQPGDRCLSIASAGDNSLALLTGAPSQVVALDLSAPQLACLELRVAAYRRLEHVELLELLGFTASDQRRRLYERCRAELSDTAERFWAARPLDIDLGIAHAGKFERYLAWVRRRALPVVHTRRRIDQLLAGGTPAERAAFYRSHWDTWRWRRLLDIVCSRPVLGRLGRDPSFFAHARGRTSQHVQRRTCQVLGTLNPADNPYLQWILRGPSATVLPLALRAEHFNTIRANLDALVWRQQSVADFLGTCPPGSMDAFNLSDVFEYMSLPLCHELYASIARAATPGARLAYWNMQAERQRPRSLSCHLRPLPELAARLLAADKVFFYRAFQVEEIVGGS
jgi:S-adenosylmethionine-diacylglycerol 3-amino-3-carboxypropyl transferase